jgi:penicillin amidase
VTNVGADVQDLYREQLSPDGAAALFRGTFEPLTVVTETIAVRDRDPVVLRVRSSRHGPLISDAINANLEGTGAPPLEPLAFQWTALAGEDTTLPAFLGVNAAGNWAEFTAALSQLVTPAQNFVYADVDGHIGYYAPGRIPVRARGDGSVPAEGWTGEMEWTGFVPFDELPHAFDPPAGFIVTANHRPAAPPYPHLIALEYPEPYRAERIAALIRERDRATVDDMRAIQADTRSSHAAALLPFFLSRVNASSDRERQAVELLRQWDLTMGGGEAAGAIFTAWFFQVVEQMAGDDLGPALTARYLGLFSYATRFVTRVLEEGDESWCDHSDTAPREGCDEIVIAALRAALDELETRMGRPERWRWDVLHPVVFPHQALDSVGWLRPFVSRRVPGRGDFSTVNVGAASVDPRFEQRAAAGYRQIIDLSLTGDSRFLDAVGQSGHPLSPHYDDFLEDWRAVAHRPMRMGRAAIESGAIGRLTLRPR